MSLKDIWTDKIDGFDVVEAEHINEIAHSVMKNEEDIVELKNSKIELAPTLEGNEEDKAPSVKAVNEGLAEKVDKSSITQTISGNEEDKAPSVKAVNEELDKLGGRIARNDKRITNIEQGIPPELFETDSSVAYTKDVPQNALPFAEISKIGGMTRKCTNLIPYPYTETTRTENGITFTDNGDGTVTANGTATANSVFYSQNNLVLPSGNYVLSGGNNAGSTSVVLHYLDESGNSVYITSYSEESFSLTEQKAVVVYLQVFSGKTVSNFVFKPMLNEGTEPLPYEPYFEGLRSASVTEIESVGVNLIDLATFKKQTGTPTVSGEALSITGYLAFTDFYGLEAGNYHFSAKSTRTGDEGGGASVMWYSAEEVITSGIYKTDVLNPSISFTVPAGTLKVRVVLYGSGRSEDKTNSSTYTEVMFNRGSTALPYSPYVKHTLPIPKEVQALDGYGWGVNKSVYNYIDFEKKPFVKRVKKVVFDGSADENITIGMRGTEFTLFKAEISGGYNYSPAITNRDIPYKVALDANDAHFYVNEGEVLFALSNSIATDVATLKTYLASNPIEFIYELAEPIVTDISDILPADNFIEVEGGGTITAVNENGFDVPSEITYMLEEETV